MLELRSRYFPPKERDRYLPYSMFDYGWTDIVSQNECEPVLFIAAGLFLYFQETQVIAFVRHLADFPNSELVFDTVSPAGLKITRHMINKMGKQETPVYFAVARAADFAAKISPKVMVTAENKFYQRVDFRCEMAIDTRLRMHLSNILHMVKMIHFQLHPR